MVGGFRRVTYSFDATVESAMKILLDEMYAGLKGAKAAYAGGIKSELP